MNIIQWQKRLNFKAGLATLSVPFFRNVYGQLFLKNTFNIISITLEAVKDSFFYIFKRPITRNSIRVVK